MYAWIRYQLELETTLVYSDVQEVKILNNRCNSKMGVESTFKLVKIRIKGKPVSNHVSKQSMEEISIAYIE